MVSVTWDTLHSPSGLKIVIGNGLHTVGYTQSHGSEPVLVTWDTLHSPSQ